MGMRIGVLTGGGDVPGLNVAVKAIAERAEAQGWEVIGIRRGWLGLLAMDPADPASVAEWSVPLTRERVRAIDRSGGTVLHTSRVDPQNLPKSLAPERLQGHFLAADKIDATGEVVKAVQALKLDAVIPLGGDGTLRFAARLSKEGIPIVSIPKTMDNDVFGTDYAIGFSTAITRSVDAITALRTTGGSHERIVVVELFGRYCGQTALYAGLLSAADRVVIAESPFDRLRVAELLEADRLANPSKYSVAVISEGARPKGGDRAEKEIADAYGRRALGGIGELLGAACRQASSEGVIVQNLAYLMRSGPPDATDRMIAVGFGALAIELLQAKRFGHMCALHDGRFHAAAVDAPLGGPKHVNIAACYDPEAYRPRLAGIDGIPLFGI
jgi:6-phosphofructokinase